MIKELFSILPKDPLYNSDTIINWSPLKRCILMLLLACGMNILWVVWKIYITLNSELHQFVNLPLLHTQIGINLFFLFVLILLIYPCYKLKASLKAQQYLPYLCISIFVFTLIYDGYYVGIMSPATTCGTICVVAVGLVLFSRKIIYIILIPSIIILIYLMVLSINNTIPYAPVFRLDVIGSEPYFNSFWLGSMLFFMTPIAVCSFFLFDIILCQWRNRELTYQTLSQIDPLTRLLNRRSINEYLLELEDSEKDCASCYIILMDIDFFKTINDSYGHLKGDEVLVKVADTLKLYTRPEDLVGRYGGEEFIILSDTPDITSAQHIAERCRLAIMNLNLDSRGSRVKVTASFGISYWKKDAGILRDALHKADVAMYQAKKSGRNQVVYIP